MSEWRGVLKYRGNYYTATKPRWSSRRELAHIFESRELATKIRSDLRARHVAKHDADPRIIVTRLRRPSVRREDESAARRQRTADDDSLRAKERVRVATWLETWHRLNAMMLTAPRFTAGNPHKKSFTEGMVFVLKQAATRIRDARFHTEWEYPF